MARITGAGSVSRDVRRSDVAMRCSKCGAKVKYVAGGHGSSDAPGHYFWPGLIALIVAVLGFCLGHEPERSAKFGHEVL